MRWFVRPLVLIVACGTVLGGLVTVAGAANKVDPCALITPGDLQQVFGVAFKPGEPGVIPERECRFNTVAIGSSTGTPPAGEITVTTVVGKDAKRYFKGAVTGMKRDGDLVKVAGLGGKAYFTAPANFSPALLLLRKKSYVLLQGSISTLDDEHADQGTLVELMKLALDKQ